ncbi:Hint domain-containing protein [Leisingera methylohalidivorans]|uniref:Hint domain-containing protein n=1 Tax=Leisingera methylohalidivorans TaxID=133924 RepID=UPI001FDF41B6|nr:Hint domain-containing protein [Leisingera methylohalidivorans]
METLHPGDLVLTADHGAQPILWTRSRYQSLDEGEDEGKPVLIQARALGSGLPEQDLVVSPQHRILVGGGGQLTDYFKTEVFAPAKSLTKLPGIRHMKGKRGVNWVHFACARHEVVLANGCQSESLLLGPMVMDGLGFLERQNLIDIFGAAKTPCAAPNGPPARECLTVGTVRRQLKGQAKMAYHRRARNIQKWDEDAAMERHEAEMLHAAEPVGEARKRRMM